MKYWTVTFSRLPADAMAIYPLMIFKKRGHKESRVIINHEMVHFKQQLELLVIFFYLLYFLHYLINLIKFRNHRRAYFEICFEKEAYANERNFKYLKQRTPYAWLKYF
jgi:beta-lactamase regulating signal transducer with metallopeptidase domain